MENLKQKALTIKACLEQIEVKGSNSIGHMFLAFTKLEELMLYLKEIEEGGTDVNSDISG